MISDSTFDLIREAWLASIPKQYRYREKFREVINITDRHLSPAIIAAPPPPCILDRWFRIMSERQHVTQEQLRALEVREARGKKRSTQLKDRHSSKPIESSPGVTVGQSALPDIVDALGFIASGCFSS